MKCSSMCAKKIPSLVLLSTLLSGGSAMAASFSDIKSGELSVNVLAPAVPVDVSIGQASNNGSLAGNFTDGQYIAYSYVSVVDPLRLGVRWTPSVGTDTAAFTKRFVNKNNAAQSITLRLQAHESKPSTPVTIGGDTYIVTNNAVVQHIAAIAIAGNQTINPGIYAVSVDATVYTP